MAQEEAHASPEAARHKPRALVTGAGNGIGKAIAEHLVRAGYRVFATIRDAAKAEALTAEAKRNGVQLRYLALELGSLGSVDAVATWVEREGGVDLLVHNAGFGVFGPIEEVNAEATARQFAVNVFGPLHLTRRLLPTLRERRGRVVFIGSLAGRLALPFQAHYSATKAAIASLSDALRIELAPFGVTVTCIEPGDFKTGFTDARVVTASPDSPYKEQLDKCLAAVNRQERGGPGPEWVAKVVEELVKTPRPPARRPVGRWARAICFLLRMLPDRLRERLVRGNYDLV